MAPVFRTTKLWLGLGVFTLIHAGMAPDAIAQQPGTAVPLPAVAQGGEGGEGGEGGISVEQAAVNPDAFIGALDVVAAHYLAGREAYDAGQPQAAAELFAHPIAEVYADMEPVFQAKGVIPFRDAMERASELALARAPQAAIASAVDTVLAALAAAEAKAPAPGGTATVQARVAADLMDRAALQSAAAAREPTELEPYLDGYGLYLAAQARAQKTLPALESTGRQDIAERMRSVLRALRQSYPGPARPIQAATMDDAALLAEASRLKLLVGALQ